MLSVSPIHHPNALCLTDPLACAEQLLWLIEQRQPRDRRIIQQQRALRHTLAVTFGQRNGWALSRTPFSLRALRRGKVHSGPSRAPDATPGTLPPRVYSDHPYYYRHPVTRKAEAIACHLYQIPADLHAWCALWGLVGSPIDDFPSWWYPGRTHLVVLQRDPAPRP